MKKRNYPDETIKMVSKICENQKMLWSLFVKGAKKYLSLPGKFKMEEFEKIEISSKISIPEFLEIYKLNFLFGGSKEEEEPVIFLEESMKKAEKFIEKNTAPVETLKKNYEFMWNICLLSTIDNLSKNKEFKDVAKTMQTQIDNFLTTYQHYNQKGLEKKFSDISKFFKAFDNFENNFKKEEENNRRDSLNRVNNQKAEDITPKSERKDETSKPKQKNKEKHEKGSNTGEKKEKISCENNDNVENNEEEEKICPKDSSADPDKKDFLPKINRIVDDINQLFEENAKTKQNSLKLLNKILGKEEFSLIDPFEFCYISLKRLKINIQVLMTANIKSTEDFQTERQLKEKEVLVSPEKIDEIQRKLELENNVLREKAEKLKNKLKEKSEKSTEERQLKENEVLVLNEKIVEIKRNFELENNDLREAEKHLKEQLEDEKQKNKELNAKIEKMNSKYKEELNQQDQLLDEKEKELSKIKKNIISLKEQDKQKTKEIQDLNTQYEALSREKKEDEDKIKSKDSEIKKQRKNLSEKDQFIQNSQIEMTDLKAQNQTHLKEKEALIKELSSYKEKFENLKKVYESNLLKLSDHETEISRLNKMKIRLDKDFEEYKTAKHNEMEEKTDIINQMQQNIQEQNISLENNGKIIQKQRATISELQQNIQELNSSREEQEKIMQQQQGEIKNSRSNIKDLQERLKILISEKKANEATISDQANQIKELTAEKEKLNQEVESLTKAKTNLKNEIENLKEEKNELKKENKDLEAKKLELKKQNEDLEETTASLQKKLKKEKKAFETETSKLKNELTDEQAAKNEFESKFQKYKEKYQKVNQEYLAFKSHFHLGEEESLPKKSNNSKKKEKLPYDMVINIDSLRTHDLGWEITLNDKNSDLLSSSLGNQTVIGFVGRENIGKTYILNKICGFELPSGSNVNTKGLSVKLSNDNNLDLVCLDSAGIQTPVYYFEEKLLQRFNVSKENLKKNEEIKRQMINDRTITDVFIQDFILDVCEVIIVVVGQLSQNDQKFIERIAWKYQAKKRIIVIHNFSNLLAVSDVEAKIQRDIIKAFDATPQLKHTSKNKEMTYYIETTSKPNCENITHLVLGVDWSDSGKIYNDPTFEYLKDVLETRTDKKTFDLIPRLQEFFKENYRLYLKFKRLPKKEVRLEFDKKHSALVINADEEFEVSNPIFNSLGSLVTNPPYDVIERKDLYIVLIEIPDLIWDSLQFNLDRKKSEFNCLIVLGEKNISDILESKKNIGVVGNRNHGQFKCLIPLGPNSYIIKLKERKVEYENGILKVEVKYLTEENEDI